MSSYMGKYAESQTKKVIRIIELKYDVEAMFRAGIYVICRWI